MQHDYEYLVNRVQLHTCKPSYCLKQMFPLQAWRCRCGFPLTEWGFKKEMQTQDGKQYLHKIVRTEDFQLGADFVDGKLEFLRNHGRLVMHIPELLSLWRGNIDAKPITNPNQTLQYILKYMCKPEEGSLTFTDMVKILTEKTDENSPIRKLFQRIVLKTISEHDISKNECWKIISGKPYVEYSHPFVYLNLTGTRRLNIQAGQNEDNPAIDKNNYVDTYWCRDEDENYKYAVQRYESGEMSFPVHPRDVSLYQYASSFSLKWHPSPTLKVPHTTPSFKYIPIVDNIEYRKVYCQITLLLHKPGINPENMLDGESSAEQALYHFVTTDDRCPKVIREDHLQSLQRKPTDPPPHETGEEDLIASPMPGGQHGYEEHESMIGLGPTITTTTIDDAEPVPDDDD